MKTQDLLEKLLANPGVAGIAGGILGGLLSGKAGRKLGKSALKVGGAAAVAGLAYSAWRHYQDAQAQRGAGLGAGEPTIAQLVAGRFLPEPQSEDAGDDLARVLLMAMAAAARADGRLDEKEAGAIRARLADLELDDRSRTAIESQLQGPVDLDALVRAAKTRELALEIYTASLLAIDVDTASERGHLMVLADRLGLPDELVQAVHREVAARVAASTELIGETTG